MVENFVSFWGFLCLIFQFLFMEPSNPRRGEGTDVLTQSEFSKLRQCAFQTNVKGHSSESVCYGPRSQVPSELTLPKEACFTPMRTSRAVIGEAV